MTKHHWHSPESRPAKPGYYFRFYGNKEADSVKDVWDGTSWNVIDGDVWVRSDWPLRWREE